MTHKMDDFHYPSMSLLILNTFNNKFLPIGPLSRLIKLLSFSSNKFNRSKLDSSNTFSIFLEMFALLQALYLVQYVNVSSWIYPCTIQPSSHALLAT